MFADLPVGGNPSDGTSGLSSFFVQRPRDVLPAFSGPALDEGDEFGEPRLERHSGENIVQRRVALIQAAFHSGAP
jgi:hypothetical protein